VEWFVLGMAYDDKGQLPKAIEAFTKAFDANHDNVKALYQRGQDHAVLKHRADAKKDLENFVAQAPPNLGFAKETAEHLLVDL
jgi:tetratricopeptide (TPR) repeat protein